MIEVRRTYKYRLYHSQRNKHLHQTIDVAGRIWNHCIALQRRYYRLTGGYITLSRLQSHIANLRKRRFTEWQQVGSQAVQNIAERVHQAYQRFFKKQGGRPQFKKVKSYRSFTLKQAGWKILEDNKLWIQGRVYKFVKHRPMTRTIKTVTIKRDNLNRLWVCFSVIEEVEEPTPSTSKMGGFDFGLKTFLTGDDGRAWLHPEYFRADLKRIQRLNRELSRKQRGSNNWHKAKRILSRAHARIADKRRDYHFKLAHALCNEYSIIFLEDLNLKGMQALWGRKVSDLGFADFVRILHHVALKRGVIVAHIGRFDRTTGTCSVCGHTQHLELHQRTFNCKACGLILDRDHNAARNIGQVGASTYGLGDVRPISVGFPA